AAAVILLAPVPCLLVPEPRAYLISGAVKETAVTAALPCVLIGPPITVGFISRCCRIAEFARPIPAPAVAVAAARSGNGVFISRAVLITPLAVAARAIDILSLAGPVAIARSLSAIGHSLVPPVAAILLGRGVGSGGFLRIVAAPSLSPSVIGHAVILI